MSKKMNPEVKAQWVAALRSGEYQQATGELRDETGFCCLGVLCDLHSKAVGGDWRVATDKVSLYMGEPGTLAESVRQWCGLDIDNPNLTIGGVTQSAANHNDGAEGHPARSFAEIADAIEAQL